MFCTVCWLQQVRPARGRQERVAGMWRRKHGPASDGPRVIVVGAGFAGLAAVEGLARAGAQVMLVDRNVYSTFQPLLYQVATAALSPADVAWPIRHILRRQKNVTVLLTEVIGIDTAEQTVETKAVSFHFDFLIIATGATHSYFGNNSWATCAPGLKRIEDAIRIRRSILSSFERAELTDDEAERRRLLTFVIVGGGPTGVELAGAIAELARHGLAREFRAIDPSMARVILMQAGPRILPTFPEGLSRQATTALTTLGVEVLTDSAVEQIDEECVVVSGRRVAARNAFWAAGVMASPAAQWLKAEADRAGRVTCRSLGCRTFSRLAILLYPAGGTATQCPASRPQPSSRAAT